MMNPDWECGNNTQKYKDTNLSPIQTFFCNTNVFITGGTGFLGILLLEKLLVSCSEISKIFMLIRSKKGKNIDTRLDELFEDAVFFRVKKECPEFREKVVPVEGDCEFPDLGLCSQDREILTKEVNVVFHMAATIRFDEALRRASFINVRAVRDILRLAQRMPNLKSFVHVSTAYSNCIHNHIKEEIYSPPLDYRKLLNVTESLPDDILTLVTPKLLGKFPNTYSYTKQIGEDVVRQEGNGLPVGIHRPSVVLSTYKEPIRGWVNSMYGPAGLICAAGMGIVRTVKLGARLKANLVPADMVVNSIIAAAWDIAEDFDEGIVKIDNVPVYNYEADQAPILTWDNYIYTYIQNAYKYCTVNVLWYIFYVPCRNHLSFTIVTFFLHTLPAIMLDTILLSLRKSPKFLKIYDKISKLENALTFFIVREWNFDSNNLSRLKSRMSDKDKEIFFCDLRNFDWNDYFDYYAQGIRIYLLKDPLDTLARARRKIKRLYWLHQFTKSALIIVFLWIVWWWYKKIH